MTATHLLLALAAVFLGSLVQGSVGFGQSLVAAPLLLLIDPQLVPGPISVATPVLSLLVLVRDRRHAGDLHGLRWSLLGLVPGTAAAAVAVAVLPQTGLAVLAAVLVLAGVAFSLGPVHLEPAPASTAVAGLLSGFMGTTAGISGPPMALLHQRSSGGVLRYTMARFFVAGSVLTLVALAPTDALGVEGWWHGLLLVPGVVAGFVASRAFIGRVDPRRSRFAVLSLSAASAVAVLVRAAW